MPPNFQITSFNVQRPRGHHVSNPVPSICPYCSQQRRFDVYLILPRADTQCSAKKVCCVLDSTESRGLLVCTSLNFEKNSCMVVVGPVAHDTKIFSLIALIYLCFFSHSMHTHAHKDLKPPHSTSSSSPTVGSRRRSTPPRPSFLSSSHPCASPWGDHCDHQLQSAYCRNGQGLGEGGFSEMVKA